MKGYGQMAALGPDFVPLRNRSNDYLIDREEQKHRTFTGVRGVVDCLRSGSAVATEDVPFEEVMRQRFGSPLGRVLV